MRAEKTNRGTGGATNSNTVLDRDLTRYYNRGTRFEIIGSAKERLWRSNAGTINIEMKGKGTTRFRKNEFDRNVIDAKEQFDFERTKSINAELTIPSAIHTNKLFALDKA